MKEVLARTKPRLVSISAKAEFDKRCIELGYNPSSVWVGGYVDYQWDRLLRLLDAYNISPLGLNVLEFGSNVGASSIVLASLGAVVTAVDVSSEWLSIARLNAACYGIDTINFVLVPDTRKLPFDDVCFDLTNCASVLEYVDYLHLSDVQREINRVLKPGGRIVVTGTSNRLWIKEVHSHRWFINYLPRYIDRLIGKSLVRGVWPWKIRYGFGQCYINLDAHNGGRAFLAARNGLNGSNILRKTVAKIASTIEIGPGMLGHSMSCVLEKQST